MKIKLILLLLIIAGINSCRKDNYEAMLPPPDPRNAITGTYVGTMRNHFHSTVDNSDNISVTTQTVIVRKDLLDSNLVILSLVSFALADSVFIYTPGNTSLIRTTQNYSVLSCQISLSEPRNLNYFGSWSAPHAYGDDQLDMIKQ
ncbi:hypothetical protein BH09BAC5_BH09BAC5_16760 [soil metagenome]